jgi:hypothetical protein
LPLLQLQQVFPAGESGQVPVEYEQQPSPAVVVEAMRCAAGICEVKVDRGGIKAIGGR